MNLRPMTMADAEKMLEWKNYPETREFAIKSHDEIKLEDHLKWLEINIMFFRVIETSQGTPVGAIRIFADEISIWIDKGFQGCGIATRVIETVSIKGMYARIVNGNVSSFRAFVKAGFKPVSYNKEENYYLLRK